MLPVTLESNVRELHKFLFADGDYVPSDVVFHRSQKIAELGGIEVSDTPEPTSEPVAEAAETETAVPEYTETTQATEYYSSDVQDNYSDGYDYADTGYVDPNYSGDQAVQDTYVPESYTDYSDTPQSQEGSEPMAVPDAAAGEQ